MDDLETRQLFVQSINRKRKLLFKARVFYFFRNYIPNDLIFVLDKPSKASYFTRFQQTAASA